MMEQALREECVRLRLPLPEERLARLCRFAEAVLEQNRVMNLTAITDPEEVARLHLADSLALLRAAELRDRSVIDIGCGAGFPGVPLKLAEPSLRLTLLDSLQKRVLWLRKTLEAQKIEAVCCGAGGGLRGRGSRRL